MFSIQLVTLTAKFEIVEARNIDDDAGKPGKNDGGHGHHAAKQPWRGGNRFCVLFQYVVGQQILQLRWCYELQPGEDEGNIDQREPEHA